MPSAVTTQKRRAQPRAPDPPTCVTPSIWNRRLASGEAMPSRAPLKLREPLSRTACPGMNMRLEGLGVGCVWMNMPRCCWPRAATPPTDAAHPCPCCCRGGGAQGCARSAAWQASCEGGGAGRGGCGSSGAHTRRSLAPRNPTHRRQPAHTAAAAAAGGGAAAAAGSAGLVRCCPQQALQRVPTHRG